MGGLAAPAPFIRHKDMHRSVKPWAVSLSHFPHCPFLFSVSSGSSGGRQWPRGCLQFTFCAATGTRREVRFHLHRRGREGRQRGQACQKWISVSCCSPLRITRFSLVACLLLPPPPTYVEKRIPATHYLASPLFGIHVWSWAVDVFVPLPSTLQVVFQLLRLFLPKHVTGF